MLDWIDHPFFDTPFGTALVVCLILAASAWVLSLIAREVSWVDRLWSICPPVYCLVVLVDTGFVAASGAWLHWTALGFIALTAQFIPAMRLGESISVAKYPGYRDYQATTPALIPLPWNKRTSLVGATPRGRLVGEVLV
ncbi:MAG: hypothetical protein OXH09_00830 [Gammaproteobacteria bacterium]|nr:hypothetical protein [Gammaproteobacteria bacterium]